MKKNGRWVNGGGGGGVHWTNRIIDGVSIFVHLQLTLIDHSQREIEKHTNA